MVAAPGNPVDIPHMIIPASVVNKAILACSFSPDGKTILTSSENANIKLYDNKGQLIKTIQTEVSGRCTFSPDGTYILFCGGYGITTLYDRDGNKLKSFKTGFVQMTSCCAFSPDSGMVVSGSRNGFLALCSIGQPDGSQCTVQKMYDPPNHWVTDCAFSPDGRYILSTCSDGSITLSLKGGVKVKTLTHEGHYVNSCAFSPDGNFFLSAGQDGTLKVWNIDGICLFTITMVPLISINDCTFSDDGRYILLAVTNTLQIWDFEKIKRGEIGISACIKTLSGPDAYITCSFSPDKRSIVSGSGNGILRLWNISSLHL